MIKRVFDLGSFRPGDNCPLSIRAFSLFNTYGADYEQVKFFVQDSFGQSALIISFFSDITLISSGEADYEEITKFLKFTGYSSVTCSETDAERLFRGYDTFSLMKFSARPQEQEHNDIVFISNSSCEADYRRIFTLQEQKQTPFNIWYSDFALKVSKAVATGALYYKDKEVVSMALVPAKCELGAIVGSVITGECYRGKGYASKCLQALRNELNCKLYLWCSNDLEPFYEKNGYENTGKIVVVKGNEYEWI